MRSPSSPAAALHVWAMVGAGLPSGPGPRLKLEGVNNLMECHHRYPDLIQGGYLQGVVQGDDGLADR